MMTSGSRARSSSHVIQGEWTPGLPKTSMPPARSISSGVQLPAAISGSIHSMHATVGRLGALDRLSYGLEARRSPAPHPRRPLRRRAGNRPRYRPAKPDSARQSAARSPAAKRRIVHIAQADRADIALHLRQDVGRLQAFENVVEDFVNRERVARRVLHLFVDRAAVGIDVDQRFRAGRKRADRRRIIAFVRTADKQIERAQRVDDFGRAREQRNDAARSSRDGFFERARQLCATRSSYKPKSAPEKSRSPASVRPQNGSACV